MPNNRLQRDAQERMAYFVLSGFCVALLCAPEPKRWALDS